MLKPLKSHPFAESYPMMKPPALANLMKGISRSGQRHDIIYIEVDGEKMTLDGRNRELACIALNKKPRYKKFEGSLSEALDYVEDMNNEGRRQMTPGEQADSTAKTMAHRKALGETTPTQAAAAEKAGISRSTLQRAVKKTRAPEATSWTADDLKKNDELMDLFTSIAHVYGNEDAKAIRTGVVGFKLADVRMLGRMKKEPMLEIKRLVMEKHWAPKKALDLLKTMPDGFTTNDEMQNFLLGSNDKMLVVEIKGFRHICEYIS